MDNYAGITTQILNMVDASIQGYTQNAYQALSSFLIPTLNLALLLYVIFYGVSHLTAQVPFNLMRSVRHMATAAIVIYFVTNWDFFALYFGNVFTNGPAQLIGVISGGSGDPNTLLSDTFDKGITAANEINKAAGLSTLGFLIVGYSLFYTTLFVVGYALFLIILSKCALAVLLGFAPLFFIFALFDATRNFFMHYVRQVFNFALIPVFTAAILTLMLSIPREALSQLQTALNAHQGHGGVQCVFALLSFFIVFGLLHQVTGFAAGISGGGLHLNPGNIAALALGGAMGQVMGAGRRAKQNVGGWTHVLSGPARRWAERAPFRAGNALGRSMTNRERNGKDVSVKSNGDPS